MKDLFSQSSANPQSQPLKSCLDYGALGNYPRGLYRILRKLQTTSKLSDSTSQLSQNAGQVKSETVPKVFVTL